MITVLVITIAILAGTYLLALASDGFAYGLSRVVEAAFDFVELRAADRNARRRAMRATGERAAYGSSYSHAR